MSTLDTSLLVDELVALWEMERGGRGSILEMEDKASLPYDYHQVGDQGPVALEFVSKPTKHGLIVAEGDSWFDYPLKGDLLDALRKNHGYAVYQVSKAGALVEDMVYGSEHRFWAGVRPQIIETMETVAQHKPSVVLISGGGNDIAGDELPAFINRKAQGVDPLREAAIDDLIFNVFRRAYEVFIGAMQQVAEKGGFNLTVVGHNYDFPNPDGRGYSITGIIPGFSYVGPWLKPAFDRKGYSVNEGREIVKRILQKFAQLQRDLEASHPGIFTAVNLQGTLSPLSTIDWDNEMHPTWNGFSRMAAKVHTAIQMLP